MSLSGGQCQQACCHVAAIVLWHQSQKHSANAVLWCSDSAATVAQVIYNKHTKDVFQAAISRGNPNLVTPVELDFSLPRNIALAQQCQVLLNWESSYKTLSRQAHTCFCHIIRCRVT